MELLRFGNSTTAIPSTPNNFINDTPLLKAESMKMKIQLFEKLDEESEADMYLEQGDPCTIISHISPVVPLKKHKSANPNLNEQSNEDMTSKVQNNDSEVTSPVGNTAKISLNQMENDFSNNKRYSINQRFSMISMESP